MALNVHVCSRPVAAHDFIFLLFQGEGRHSGLVKKSSSAESGVDVIEYHLSSSSSSEQGARYQ